MASNSEKVQQLHDQFEGLTVAKREALKERAPTLYRTMYASWVNIEGKNSFWFFLKYVLRNPVLYEPLHKPLADWLQDENWRTQKKMLLMPRGHVKSNILTVGYAAWRIVRDPNIRIVMASHKSDDAEKFMATVAYHIKEDPWFQEVYPEIRPMPGNGKTPKLWSTKQILVKRTSGFVEPTIQCMSQNAKVTGRHYMLLICDDLVTEKNVNNAEALQATQDFHQLAESLLDPGAKELVLGTRYHYEDEYGRIQDTPEIAQLYDTKVLKDTKTPGLINLYISGQKKWTRQQDFDELAFPSRFTLDMRDYVDPEHEHLNRKSLPALRLLQGSLVYANQYQMEPLDPTTACFKEDDIPIWPGLPEMASFKVYQFLDMASEKKGTNSKTALVTVAITDAFDIYVFDVFWGDYGQRAVTDELCRWQSRQDGLRPILVGIEGGPYEIQLRAYITERQKELGVWIPFHELTGAEHNQAKPDHIRSLVPFVESRKIRITEKCRNRLQLMDEFIKYPKTKFEDCIDALAQLTKIVYPTQSKDFLAQTIPLKEEPKTGITLDEYLAQQGQEADPRRIGGNQVRRHSRADTVRF